MKSRIFNAYTFFVAGLLIITGATFAELKCPACDGTGRIPGVTGVEVMSIEAEMISHYELGMDCGWDYERYTYDVTLTVENYTGTESWGIILVTFHDPDESYWIQVEIDDEELYVEVTGLTLMSYPWFVEVPARTTEAFTRRVTFEGVTLEFFGGRDHLIEANLASSYTCPFHGETARVSLPVWLRLN